MKIIKTTQNTIKVKKVCEKHTPEVDFDLYEGILGKELVDAAYEEWGPNVIWSKNSHYYNTPFSIKKLKDMLTDLENEGCNYVSIDFNCDHPDYNLVGFKVTQATEEDIKEESEAEKNHKQAQANELRKQADKLLKEANDLDNADGKG